MAHINLWTTDGIHLVIHHLYHLVYFPRRNRRGNRIRVRMHHKALGYSENMSSKSRRNQLYLKFSIPSNMGSPKRLLLPHSDDEILSGIDEDVSSHTRWICNAGAPLGGHRECQTYRDAYERRHLYPQPKYCFDTSVPRLLEQTRLSILNWNPGPRRGEAGTIEEHIANGPTVRCKRLSTSNTSASRTIFYITHFAGWVVLFNKVTVHSDIKVNSVNIHDTRNGQQQDVREGQAGWALQAVISHASLCNGK